MEKKKSIKNFKKTEKNQQKGIVKLQITGNQSLFTTKEKTSDLN